MSPVRFPVRRLLLSEPQGEARYPDDIESPHDSVSALLADFTTLAVPGTARRIEERAMHLASYHPE
ncbi:MAG TPA: hypothetical protein VFJ66_01380, partial [Gaiellales bacterium]|nr:hypothetical protein [Gaiellales bacterium]